MVVDFVTYTSYHIIGFWFKIASIISARISNIWIVKLLYVWLKPTYALFPIRVHILFPLYFGWQNFLTGFIVNEFSPTVEFDYKHNLIPLPSSPDSITPKRKMMWCINKQSTLIEIGHVKFKGSRLEPHFHHVKESLQ